MPEFRPIPIDKTFGGTRRPKKKKKEPEQQRIKPPPPIFERGPLPRREPEPSRTLRLPVQDVTLPVPEKRPPLEHLLPEAARSKPGEPVMGSPFMFVGPARAVTTAQAASRLARGGIERLSNVGQVAKFTRTTEAALNSQTVKQTQSILSKVFSKRTLQMLGVWAGAVYLGKWGQAESTEPLSITMTKYLVPNAVETGNWSLVEEAQDARNELLDLEWWEEVALWSPISPLIGIPRKIEGAIAASKVQDKAIADIRQQQETGETNDERWERVRQEQAAQEKANIDYYNQERKKMLEWEREAAKQQRSEDAAFWRKEREKQRKKEEEDRKAIADFWLAYRKEMQKLADDSRPSNLNFGLL